MRMQLHAQIRRNCMEERKVTKVDLLQASVCARTGQKIFTLVCEYPRAIHAQLLTHRVFSKNSSSSRAIPVESAIQQLTDAPALPIWTINQSGMQGAVVTDPVLVDTADRLVTLHKHSAIALARMLGGSVANGGLGLHKQNVGRYLEPFQNIRIVLTSTEWDNWDWLRMDPDAQPEVRQLAETIYAVREEATPMELREGEYHVPGVVRDIDETGQMFYLHPETLAPLSLAEAIALSMSICAQTSYRKEDSSMEKADVVNKRLFSGRKIHASPSEHQATPLPTFEDYGDNNLAWPAGITHIDRNSNYWSGNFKNWIQNRQLIPGHDKALYPS